MYRQRFQSRFTVDNEIFTSMHQSTEVLSTMEVFYDISVVFYAETVSTMRLYKESGMVHWLRVETRDREIRVRYPALAVNSDLVVACHTS